MANLNQLLQSYVDKSYEELLDLANYSLAQFIGDVRAALGDSSTAKICALITAACLGADGRFTELENRFFNDLLNSNDSYENNLRFVQSLSSEEGRALADQFIDILPADKKAAAVSFCLCFLAVDETISRDEVAFVNRLID